ncbi:acyl carrier protein [Faecalicatena sp. AGMB00832]|uniref:Acyl carrier protein n=1 Tax=Faecalicatena faecalis TaxID=2726362 RepID=A0ABS6D3E6_9FIRM|nr:acyl carrier protein [Faecalicatena faecalis]
MKFKFKGSETIFEGSVKKVAQNMLLVQADRSIKGKDASVIEIVSDDGRTVAKYEGYATVYRTLEDATIYSNDGTIYTEQEEQQPDAEQIRTAKLAEVSNRCESTIFAGVDVTLSDGTTEHISLTEKDQINLFGKKSQLAAGVAKLEYHEDGQLCKYYSAEDMTAIITAAMQFVSYHTTYCNSLNAWIKGAESVEELSGIYYGAQIPDKYKSEVLKDYEAAQKA